MQPDRVQSAFVDNKRQRQLLLLMVALLGGLCIPSAALAVTNSIAQVMCNIVTITAGTTGKAICTVNIIAIGVGALLGKLSWNKAMVCTVGIALIFGSASVVDALSYNYDPLFNSTSAGTGTGSSQDSGGTDTNSEFAPASNTPTSEFSSPTGVDATLTPGSSGACTANGTLVTDNESLGGGPSFIR